MSFNVAIDGPAGAGKSTIAKQVAKKENLIYVDTGAMYRAVALYLLRSGVNVRDEKIVSEKCKEADITIRYQDGTQVVVLNGEDVGAFLRTEEVGLTASVTSAYPAVRAHLLQLQKNLAAENDCIMDGRDIGTVVLPNASMKIFLTASPEARAMRRYQEYLDKGQQATYEEVLADQKKRDYDDSHRKIAPLKQARDAILVDTTEMGLQESIDYCVSLIREKLGL